MWHLQAALAFYLSGTVFCIYSQQGINYGAYAPRLNYETKRDDYPPARKENGVPRYAITYVTTPGYSSYLYNRYAAKPRHYFENYKTGALEPQRNLYQKYIPQEAPQYASRYDSTGKYDAFKPVSYTAVEALNYNGGKSNIGKYNNNAGQYKSNDGQYDNVGQYKNNLANRGQYANTIGQYIVNKAKYQPQPGPVVLQPIRVQYKQTPITRASMEVFAKSSPGRSAHKFYRKNKKCYQCAWSPSKTDYITLKDKKVAVASRGGWDKCKGPFSQHEAKSYGVDVWDCKDNCYLRVDHNGNFFRGCYKGEYGVDPKKLGCNYQANSLYCFCDSDRCNNGPLPRHKIYS